MIHPFMKRRTINIINSHSYSINSTQPYRRQQIPQSRNFSSKKASSLAGASASPSAIARGGDSGSGSVCGVLGGQWGDEGKGKLVDILAKQYSLIARFNGGSNAGHTLVVGGKKHAFHLLPCGLLYDDKINVIGNGVVVHVPTLLKELDTLHAAGVKTNSKLFISSRAHLLFDAHMEIDGKQEEQLKANNIGTTKRGIGPCYASKATRNGIRVGELLDFSTFETKHQMLLSFLGRAHGLNFDAKEELDRYKKYAELLAPMITDTSFLIHQALKEGKSVLAEGANAALLDLDHGTYPYVTSSTTTAGGISTGLGIPPFRISSLIGVVKAYTTRVGAGPFPSELSDDVGDRLRGVGKEFGTTTGRPRRCGWLDIPVIHYAHLINGFTHLNITKLDVLTGLDKVKIGVEYSIKGKVLPAGLMPDTLEQLKQVTVKYETMSGWSEDISQCRRISDLPAAARHYLARIEQLTGLPISHVGVGPGREDMATP